MQTPHSTLFTITIQYKSNIHLHSLSHNFHFLLYYYLLVRTHTESRSTLAIKYIYNQLNNHVLSSKGKAKNKGILYMRLYTHQQQLTWLDVISTSLHLSSVWSYTTRCFPSRDQLLWVVNMLQELTPLAASLQTMVFTLPTTRCPRQWNRKSQNTREKIVFRKKYYLTAS